MVAHWQFDRTNWGILQHESMWCRFQLLRLVKSVDRIETAGDRLWIDNRNIGVADSVYDSSNMRFC